MLQFTLSAIYSSLSSEGMNKLNVLFTLAGWLAHPVVPTRFATMDDKRIEIWWQKLNRKANIIHVSAVSHAEEG